MNLADYIITCNVFVFTCNVRQYIASPNHDVTMFDSRQHGTNV